MSETSAVTPMTVADYAFAVESLSSGRFTGLLGSVAFRVDRSLPEGVAVGRLGRWKSSSRKHWV